LYHAEKQSVKALPQVGEKASSPEMNRAIEDQLMPASWLTVSNAPAGIQCTNYLSLTRSNSLVFYWATGC